MPKFLLLVFLKAIPSGILTLTAKEIAGKHPIKHDESQQHRQNVQNQATKKQIHRRYRDPKQGQKLIQRVITVPTVHKTGNTLCKPQQKIQSLLLPPITIAKRRRNCVNDTDKAAT